LPPKIQVGRYHSWAVEREGLPDSLVVTAEDENGQIMALRHKAYDVRGVQFHPESIMTPEGKQMLRNWLKN
jgi:anthranilate synthase component 2